MREGLRRLPDRRVARPAHAGGRLFHAAQVVWRVLAQQGQARLAALERRDATSHAYAQACLRATQLACRGQRALLGQDEALRVVKAAGPTPWWWEGSRYRLRR